MKELSLEEKAKRYDEAIERGKQILNTPYTAHWDIMKEVVEHLFPELKESEDEKIRKWLVEELYNSVNSSISKGFDIDMGGKALAWLEKQGEYAKFRNKIQIGDKVTRNQDGVLVNLSQLKRVAKPAENQGEQILANSAKTCKDEQKPVEPQQDMLSQEKYAKAVDECIYDEQKPADKVEPKFKVGDKIRKKTPSPFDRDMQVARIEKDYYVCNHIGKFSSEVVPFSKQSSYELIEHNPAWSDEDEQYLLVCKNALAKYQVSDKWDANIISRWLENRLKSLRPQSHWKPSDEQMLSLERASNSLVSTEDTVILRKLLNDLKKL